MTPAEEAMGRVIRRDALHRYIDDCAEEARRARQRGDDEREAWWAGEELGARGALLGLERA